MKRLLSIIAVTLLMVISASAQLVSQSKAKGCDVGYPTAAVSVNVPDGAVIAIKSEYVAKGVLVSKFAMEYSGIGTEYMLKSVQVTVRWYKKEAQGALDIIPAREEIKTIKANFHPVDKNNMERFKAVLDIGESGWDQIDINYVDNSAEIIKKTDYKPSGLL